MTPITDETEQGEVQEPPGTSTPPHPWEDVPLSKWQDWRWQLRNRINDPETLGLYVWLSEEERSAMTYTAGPRPVAITPYYASLLDAVDVSHPLRRTMIPRSSSAGPPFGTPLACQKAKTVEPDATETLTGPGAARSIAPCAVCSRSTTDTKERDW